MVVGVGEELACRLVLEVLGVPLVHQVQVVHQVHLVQKVLPYQLGHLVQELPWYLAILVGLA